MTRKGKGLAGKGSRKSQRHRKSRWTGYMECVYACVCVCTHVCAHVHTCVHVRACVAVVVADFTRQLGSALGP